MPIGTRLAGTYTFTGAANQTNVLDPLDLSRCRSLKLNLKVTAAATNGSDVLDLKIQDTIDGVTWNTRGRFTTTLGNQAVTTPYMREMVIENNVDLQSGEKEYQVTGSQGGTELTAGAVLNGTFYAPYRDQTGKHGNWRLVWTVTNGSGTASFTAVCQVYGTDWNI